MQNVNVLIYVESRYKANRKRIKNSIKNVLAENNIKSAVEVSVAIVGDRKMGELNQKYRGKDGTTNVLSFPLREGKSTSLPSDVIRLGDIVVSYPQVIKEAARDEMLVDEKIEQLVSHGLFHLLGMHHE